MTWCYKTKRPLGQSFSRLTAGQCNKNGKWPDCCMWFLPSTEFLRRSQFWSIRLCTVCHKGWFPGRWNHAEAPSTLLTCSPTLSAFSLIPALGSGSDAASLLTSAKRQGDLYILNGSKVPVRSPRTTGTLSPSSCSHRLHPCYLRVNIP